MTMSPVTMTLMEIVSAKLGMSNLAESEDQRGTSGLDRNTRGAVLVAVYVQVSTEFCERRESNQLKLRGECKGKQ